MNTNTLPLAGTRFAYPAPTLTKIERLAEVEEMRRLIRTKLAHELAATPTFLVVEPDVRICSLLNTTFAQDQSGEVADTLVLPTPDQMRCCRMSDVWLAIIAIDAERYDAVQEIGAIIRRFPHARLLGRAAPSPKTRRGDLFDAGLTVILDERDLIPTLPSLIAQVRTERRTLPARLEREFLRKQVIHRHGMDSLADAGLEMRYADCPTFDHMERELIKRALRVAEGRRANAARLLGMSRTTLYRRLRRHALTHYCRSANDT